MNKENNAGLQPIIDLIWEVEEFDSEVLPHGIPSCPPPNPSPCSGCGGGTMPPPPPPPPSSASNNQCV